MSRSRVERRLEDIGERLGSLRAEARIGADQLAQVTEEAEDARLRALVSDTPLAAHEHREAKRHAEVFERRHRAVVAEISKLERRQDELLDELAATVNRF